MTLNPGTRLGSYEITSLLGSGGMGQVYRAKDLKLGRDVAVKVLREELASDPERLRRFEQEARSASALNHPNIITIYDIHLRPGYGGQVGKHGDTPFIAMEFVEGKTLRALLAEGPLPAKKLLQLTTQIAEGLAKAHSAGIVHRDLKPENLMVTTDGFLKILDFGLAKLMPEQPGIDSEMATLTKQQTQPGVVMGTFGYMSPEQAAGRSLDYRSDQFSFGSILYEMTTGKRAFWRDSSAETLAAVLKEEPEPATRVVAGLPEHFQAVLDRCLAKEPEARYDSTKDLARDLATIREHLHIKDTPAVAKPKRRRKRRTKIRSLVVLPLANMSKDPEQEYFADGMTEALITDLAKIRALKVISRTSAMRYKGTDKALPEIAEELDVDGVIEGSVLRAGERVRITAQLIHARSDQHIWAESYERDLKDILSLQSEVARAVAQEIQIKLTPKEAARLSHVHAIDPEVHQLYLKGRFFGAKFTPDSLTKSLALFQEAVDKDPHYAPAYAGLADVYNFITYFTDSAPKEVTPKAKAAAMKALELDETLADAHTALAWIKANYDWDWLAAEKQFQRALELDPGSSNVLFYYSSFLTMLERHEEAIREARHLLELDPHSILAQMNLGRLLLFGRQYDEGIDHLRETVEMNPSVLFAWALLGVAYSFTERHEEAIEALEKAWPRSGEGDIRSRAWLGYVYARAGQKIQALEILRELETAFTQRYVPPTAIANVYGGLGEMDSCIEWLEKGYEMRDGDLTHYPACQAGDDFRHDPRYQDLRRRMNYPD